MKLIKSLKNPIILAPFIIVLALLISTVIVKTKPQPEKKSLEAAPLLVEVVKADQQSLNTKVFAQGKIKAALELSLPSEVSGKLVYKNPKLTKGGMVEAGELLARIDQTDYELRLAQKKAALARAQVDLAIESAKQQVALEEFTRRENKALLDAQSQSLAKREPYLAKARSDFLAAQKEVLKAEQDLGKTKILSPMKAWVSNSLVEENQIINAGQSLADLIGLDEFLAELNLPLSELSNIDLPSELKAGSKVKLSLLSENKSDAHILGEVTMIAPKLGELAHMASVIVSIKNPLNLADGVLKGTPLLPGALVQAEIEGKNMENVWVIPRQALYDNNYVMTAKNDHALKKSIEIFRGEKDFVYIKNGLDADEILITTKISTLRDGSPIQLANNKD